MLVSRKVGTVLVSSYWVNWRPGNEKNCSFVNETYIQYVTMVLILLFTIKGGSFFYIAPPLFNMCVTRQLLKFNVSEKLLACVPVKIDPSI